MKDSLILVFFLTLAVVGTEGWNWDFIPQAECEEDQCSILGACWPLNQENDFCGGELQCPCAPGLKCEDVRPSRRPWQRPRLRPRPRPRPRPGPGTGPGPGPRPRPGGFDGLFGRSEPFDASEGGSFGGSGPLMNEGSFGGLVPYEEGEFAAGPPSWRRRPPGRFWPNGRGGRGRGRWPVWRRRSRLFAFSRCVNSTNLTTPPDFNVTVIPTTVPDLNVTFEPTTVSDFNTTVQPTTLPGLNTTVQPTTLPDLNITVQSTTLDDFNLTVASTTLTSTDNTDSTSEATASTVTSLSTEISTDSITTVTAGTTTTSTPQIE